MSAPEPTIEEHTKPPAVDVRQARDIARDRFGLDANATELPSYIDRNFRIDAQDGTRWVLKIANADEDPQVLDLQHRALEHLSNDAPDTAPTLRRSVDGATCERIRGSDGRDHLAWVVSFVDGPLWHQVDTATTSTWRSIGALLARVDASLAAMVHPASARRELRWDLARATWTIGQSRAFADPDRRRWIERVQLQFCGDVVRHIEKLPHALIHNDANDHNVVITSEAEPRAAAVIDFGDMLYTARVFEVAIAGAYAVLDAADPVEVLSELVAGYDATLPLEDVEFAAIFPSVAMRLAVSVTVSHRDSELDPDNDYIRVTEARAWSALERFDAIDPESAAARIRAKCRGDDDAKGPRPTSDSLRSRRAERLGPSMSLSYRTPLHIVRGRGTYLFDATGRAYLDCVNNVCHVGHCHPHVVAAAQRQIAELNTNTRYLHDNVVSLAERLTARLPDPLEVCYFVNSGSEANELALRLARAHTDRYAVAAVKWGYHGHTSALVDISSYKHDRKGGRGAPDWVHIADCPDVYRGECRDATQAGAFYAQNVADVFAAADHPIAAFFCEPLIGCGGQIVPPNGYLSAAFEHARAAGAVCVADEVQVGFGRVGSHDWAFEALGATPDILTLGKPFGNGHPLAAVVTTREIAASFANGMEFFSTFGGNPVSAAIGLAVLDVLDQEGLRENAAAVGARLLAGFRDLAQRHEAIGDVRGIGLYLGVELVRDRETRAPDPELLAAAIESARETGVLLSSDGPGDNVLKIKPPLCFSAHDADLLLSVFDRALRTR